jgi:predicted alpha-1,2-mannosidase
MVSRRNFLGGVSAASMTCLVKDSLALPSFDSLLGAPSTAAADFDNTKLVKIAIGTGGHGHTYPGATMPFGAVQLSPDTGIKDWDHCSGYHYADSSILGFSHTHLSGTGCIDMHDVLLMPATDDFKFDPQAKPDSPTSYRSRFSHSDEQAVPGYYSVYLQDSKVNVELVATERVGIHRYTFPQSDNAHFLVDLAHAGDAGTDAANPDAPPTPSIRRSSLNIIGNDAIVGGRCTDIWAKGRQIYFFMKFSKPFETAEIYSGGKPVDGETREAKSASLRCVLKFKTHANEVVHVKTGISGVSVEGAAANIMAEAPGWDFDGARTAAHAAWQRELGRIHVSSNDQKYLEMFYTGLYHMMVAPTLFDDADGQYRGMDGKVHKLPKGAHNYSTFSLWDTYRALHPMYRLILGERVPDFVNCPVRMAEQSPQGVPVWPLQGSETGCM